jgi:hypothetical protein
VLQTDAAPLMVAVSCQLTEIISILEGEPFIAVTIKPVISAPVLGSRIGLRLPRIRVSV